jgi:hypothetical protein
MALGHLLRCRGRHLTATGKRSAAERRATESLAGEPPSCKQHSEGVSPPSAPPLQLEESRAMPWTSSGIRWRPQSAKEPRPEQRRGRQRTAAPGGAATHAPPVRCPRQSKGRARTRRLRPASRQKRDRRVFKDSRVATGSSARGLRRRGCLYEPGLVCEYDGLDAVAEAEFLEDVGDVCFDGCLADVELFPDLGVG